MKLTAEERAERRDAFRRMNFGEKLDYLFTYYKLPVILILLAAYVVGYAAYRRITRREVLLYAALVNIASAEETERTLSEGFLYAYSFDAKQYAMTLYSGVYLTNDASLADHEYAYASRLKLMAAVDAERLDVLLMDREAYDLLSADGYLLELTPDLFQEDPELYQRLAAFLTENAVILEDNAVEHRLNEAEPYRAETVRQGNAVEISRFSLFQTAGYEDSIYCGIVRNTSRLPAAVEYLDYLTA